MNKRTFTKALLDAITVLLIAVIIVGFIFMAIVESQAADVEITWEKPTQRENGAALQENEIGGYRVYYESNGLERIQEIDGNITKTVISDLFGLYSFSVTTIDSNGLESKRSDVYKMLLSYQIKQILEVNVKCQAPLICVDPDTGEILEQ